MNRLLLLLAFVWPFAPAQGQVEIVGQKFDYATFTYDITLVNRDTGNVLLTEIAADYEVYIYIIWMGEGNPPQIKSSATYELPVYLARGCLDSTYMAGRIYESETGLGFWTCQSSIQADPALLLPPNRKVRFQVQLKPEGYKAYWEMEVDMQLTLHCTNGQKVKTGNKKIFSQDIVGYFLAERILKKDRIMRQVESKDGPELIELRHEFGKLYYGFNKGMATCQLDKIGLSADSLDFWLGNMLLDEDQFVQVAACKMIRKHHRKGLTEAVKHLLLNMPENSGTMNLEAEILYTLVELGDSSALGNAISGFVAGKKNCGSPEHLQNRQDRRFYEKVIDFLQNRPPNPDERASALGDLYRQLIPYHTPETTRLWRQALETDTVPEVSYAVIGGLEERLSKRLAGDSLAYAYAALYPKFYESSRSYDRENLLYLLCRTGDAAQAEHYLKKAMRDPDRSVRQYAVGLLITLESEKSPPGASGRHWMWELARLRRQLDSAVRDSVARERQGGFRLRGQSESKPDSLITVTRAALARAEEPLCRPETILTMSPEDALLLAAWLDYEEEGSWSRHPRRQAVLTAICQPAGLKKMSPVQLGVLATLVYEQRDSARLEAVVQALEARVQALKRQPLPAPEMLEAAITVGQMLGTMYQKDARRERWYRLVTAFYEAIPAAYQPAVLPVARWNTDLAWFELESGRPEKALAAAERARAGTNDQYARVLYAHALLLNGRTKEARTLYEGLKKEICTTPGYFYEEPLPQTLLYQLRSLKEKNAVPEARKQDVEVIRAWLEN